MKLNTYCPECLNRRIDAANGAISENVSHYIPVDIRDDGFCEGTCPYGHHFASLFQNPKFELLFDMGGLAILDGYYRESVANFASALERFYEFYVRALCIESSCTRESFMAAWKLVANQSERQLGAFAFLYLLKRKIPINMRSIEDKTSFRNSVIHKGMIPGRNEALAYGNVVMKFIVERLMELRQDGCNVLALAQQDARQLVTGKKTVLVDEMVSTIIHVGHVNDDGFGTKSLEDLLIELARYRDKVYTR